MTRGINKVILVGRLGADPDLRFAPNGTAIARFNVATTERVPVGEGNWEDRTEWHRIVVFGKLAETCGNYLSKGRLVYIEGRLRTQQWEDRQGVRRFTTEVVARDIQFLDSGVSRGDASVDVSDESARSYEDDTLSETLTPLPDGDSPDEDIPF
ncbi:single-stranded DNA-binding protein [Thermodesulforhabdus norvegica]|uniref:Single-stranded DNA-binding protein n=1 Tax=Thermodesulforhabdus norvegica TaxID=39841 RepID=A0A1I4T4Z9_9BACT|nr:single-stranded DNA-binding protein [Thermodesulforhabdus norvegica]SFM71834.1 single-strand binding protein [Thermodesulforhabdus norvegica]